MTQKDKRIFWRLRVGEWAESGLSIAAWCDKHQVNKSQMYYWKSRISSDNVSPEKEDSETSWLPIQVHDADTEKGSVFIHFDSISVEVRPDANRKLLSDVVRLLRMPC